MKALGISMGAPIHQVQHLVDKHQIQVFSANFALYGDMSARVMATLGQFTDALQVYSIDESFLDFSAVDPAAYVSYAQEIRETVGQWTKIPISIGVSTTKTLAKLANRLAKKTAAGVLALRDPEEIKDRLAAFPVEDVWGIGNRHAEFLHAHKIHTALQLARAPDQWVRHHLHVTGQRTAMELRGISCLPLELEPQPKKQIMSCRAFGSPVTSLKDLKEAVSAYVSRAAEKLRGQHSLASVLCVFLSTNSFHPELPQAHRSLTIHLAAATNDTPLLAASAQRAIERLYQPGYQYHRAGVMLAELTPDTHRQLALFDPQEGMEPQRPSAMLVMDEINQKFGRNTIRLAAVGIQQPWRGKQAKKSPAYTTRLSDLPVARSLWEESRRHEETSDDFRG